MKVYFFVLVVIVLLQACSTSTENSSSFRLRKEDKVFSDTLEISIKGDNKQERYFNFPIPNLDSILVYNVTSGIAGKYPSNTFYNPSDSGILVFYSLLPKINRNGIWKRIGQHKYYGGLTTHTYYKKSYGWAAEDKDQTFIRLNSNTPFFNINDSIGVGHSRSSIEEKLGHLVLIENSTRIYLGLNGIIGKFTYENDTVVKFDYGHYSIQDSIFELSEVELEKAIKRIIN